MNRFGMLSQEEKMELLELSTAEVFNRGYKYCCMDNEPSRFTVVEDKEKKSKNQQRKELIREAKDNFKNQLLFNAGDKGGIYVDIDGYAYLLSFQVNSEAGVVVALVKNFNGKVISKGIARCMAGDVFNEDIGKYISTSRAFGEKVEDKFLDSVQPDEIVVGHILTFAEEDSWHKRHNYRVDSLKGENNLTVIYNEVDGMDYRIGKKAHGYLNRRKHYPIIDDTDAEY